MVRRRRRRVVLVVAAGLLSAACGSEPQPSAPQEAASSPGTSTSVPTGAGEAPTSSVTATSASPPATAAPATGAENSSVSPTDASPTTSGAAAASPSSNGAALDRNATAPAGFAEQIGLFQGGGRSYAGAECEERSTPGIHVVAGTDEQGDTALGRNLVLCFEGFQVSAPLRVELAHPSGRIEELVLDESYVETPQSMEPSAGTAERAYQLFRVVLPSDGVGRLTVSAEQAGNTASAAITVEASTQPDVRVLPLRDDGLDAFYSPRVAAGTSFQLLFTGWPAGDVGTAHLYGGEDDGSFQDGFLGTITTRVGSDGTSVVDVATAPSDAGLRVCALPDWPVLQALDPQGDVDLIAHGRCLVSGFDIVEPSGASASDVEYVTEPETGSLALGDVGDRVRAVQLALVDRGWLAPDDADGDFGPATESALQEFQRANGLEVDGRAGPRTHEALGLPYASS